MFDPDVVDVKYGVHVIFSTIPNQKDTNFEDDIEEYYFKEYKKSIDCPDEFLYKPLKYYMLGDYDVCYITLINNFKFSHRLFEPKTDKEDVVYNSHTFQSYSGFALNNATSLQKTFSNNPYSNNETKYFIGIINLKLNNGFLIGNGLEFIQLIKEVIDIKFKDNYILTQTLTWFELSLTLFFDEPSELTKAIVFLRSLNLYKLKNDIELSHLYIKYAQTIKENSLYHEILKPDAEKERMYTTSFFADTSSHFGINERLIKNHLKTNEVDNYVKDFDKKAVSIILKTEIEWQVKPGHIPNLIKLLENHDELRNCFKTKNEKIATNMVLGKCDYLIQEGNESILSNFHLIRDFVRSKDCKFYDHIRKVRTYIFLETNLEEVDDRNKCLKEANGSPNHWNDTLKKLAVKAATFKSIDEKLKALKISRQVRTKILKIFSNYNNGILDPIQFPYFLDFKIFIDNLINLINEENERAKVKMFAISSLENNLNKHISAFEEGYAVRFLNGYQFENISDFDLDFNNSIQQLLSSYGTLVHEYGRLFYKDSYGPIIQLNNLDTVSNYLSINYFGHHLTSPEFIFASLTKEILNHLKIDKPAHKQIIIEYENSLPEIKKFINESYFDEMLESGMIDINYFLIDAIRYKLSYSGKFKIYEFWFWSYIFQNSTLFDSTGMLNEQRLRMEMFRIILIKKVYENTSEHQLECPTPELYTYWIRHYEKIDFIVSKLINYSKKKPENNILRKTFQLANEICKVTEIPENENLPIREIEAIFFETLSNHYQKNRSKVTIVKRDWESGVPLERYNILYKDILYAIDPTGGVYFYNSKSMDTYFESNSKCLLEILDFSNKFKKDFITKYLS